MSVLNKLITFNHSPYYWLLITFVSISLFVSALYYQYVLELEPCVLCIHVRIWVCAFLLIGIIGLWARRHAISLVVANLLSIIAALGFLERSYQTLATEGGWSESSCGIDAGLPTWFDLERWLPALFEVRDSCGFTPYVIGKVSMAELLVVIGVITLFFTLLMTVTSLNTLFKRG